MGKGYNGNIIQTLGKTERLREEPMAIGASPSYTDNRQLLALAQGEDSEEAEAATAALIRLNTGLIRSIALRFRDRGVEWEDLMQIGTMGMIKAIRSFELERGTCFSTYAVPLILGELRRHMRDEGPIKVGRYYKKLSMELMKAKNRVIVEEGREPHIGELAALCGITAEEAALALDSLSPPLSLSEHAFGEEEGVELGAMLSDEETSGEMERLCDHIALGQAVAKLPPQWQKIIIFRFYRNKTQQQTAEALGLSQVKVSREEKKILAFLREEMVR